MASNRGVAYIKPGVVEIQSIDYPTLAPGDRKCDHGVILKIVSTGGREFLGFELVAVYFLKLGRARRRVIGMRLNASTG